MHLACKATITYLAMYKIKSRYNTMQLMRFPLLFGSILGLFITAFSFRKSYFGEEIEAVRQKNYEESVRQHEIMERAKEAAAEEMLARSKAKQF